MGSLFHLAIENEDDPLIANLKSAVGERRSLGECIVTTIRFIICNLLRKWFYKKVILKRMEQLMESKVPKVLFIRYFFNDSILCDWWCRFSRYAEGYNEFISQLIIPIFFDGDF